SVCASADSWLLDVMCRLRVEQALAATHAGQRFDRAPGFSGDLCDLPVLGLDIGLGEQVSVDLAEFRARHFTVRGARPVLVENIEEKEFFNAAYRGTSGHPQSPECFGNILQIVIRRNPPREAAPETP